MTLDDAIRELESARARHGGGAVVPAWATALLFPSLSDPPAAIFPTSREFAAKLTPAVRQAIRETKPGGMWGFLVRALPILLQIVGIILMLLPLFAAAQAKAGAMQAPAGGWRWPWADPDDSIPESVRRAAAMGGEAED